MAILQNNPMDQKFAPYFQWVDVDEILHPAVMGRRGAAWKWRQVVRFRRPPLVRRGMGAGSAGIVQTQNSKFKAIVKCVCGHFSLIPSVLTG
jgi:hypothetical protein